MSDIIVVEGLKLIGAVDSREVPIGGVQTCRVRLTIDDDGQITKAAACDLGYPFGAPKSA